jgi:hypothetical protein
MWYDFGIESTWESFVIQSAGFDAIHKTSSLSNP